MWVFPHHYLKASLPGILRVLQRFLSMSSFCFVKAPGDPEVLARPSVAAARIELTLFDARFVQVSGRRIFSAAS